MWQHIPGDASTARTVGYDATDLLWHRGRSILGPVRSMPGFTVRVVAGTQNS